MKGKPFAVGGAVLAALIGLIHANTAVASDEDNRAVREATEQFEFALNAMFAGNGRQCRRSGLMRTT